MTIVALPGLVRIVGLIAIIGSLAIVGVDAIVGLPRVVARVALVAIKVGADCRQAVLHYLLYATLNDFGAKLLAIGYKKLIFFRRNYTLGKVPKVPSIIQYPI